MTAKVRKRDREAINNLARKLDTGWIVGGDGVRNKGFIFVCGNGYRMRTVYMWSRYVKSMLKSMTCIKLV